MPSAFSNGPARTGACELVLAKTEQAWALIQTGQPPCNAACPAGVNTKAYVALTAEGRFAEALKVLRERLPIPGVMGRVCSRPCESECTRGQFDDPVAICSLKRFVADYELRGGGRIVKRIQPSRPEKVAIIGAGPCGLTAALDLLRRGYQATIYDQFANPGGMLLAGIPSFRLPRDILSLEINDVLRAGVELKAGVRVGRDVGIEELLGQGYSAALIAAGAHKGISLGIPGEELDGIVDALSFLAAVNLHGDKSVGQKVIVIGGGDSAIDSARTALRLGASEVRIVYRRSRVEMPARDYEINEALEESVELDFLAAPVRIHGSGRVSSLEVCKMRLGEPDSSGRRRPVPIEGSEYHIPCDMVIAALGQRPELNFLSDQKRLETTKWDTVIADDRTCVTSAPGVFAAGDVVTGPATAVEAIGAAHRAAQAIASFIESGEACVSERCERCFPIAFELVPAPKESAGRIEPPLMAPEIRAKDFSEVERSYSIKSAKEEASRCLMCGACDECQVCINECDGRYLAMLPAARGEAARWGEAELIRVRMSQLEVLLEGEPAVALLKGTEQEQAERLLTPVAVVPNPELCIGCAVCEEMCSYCAIRIAFDAERKAFFPVVERSLCRGCGSCVANCPTGAMDQVYFSNEQLGEAALASAKHLVFSCIWQKSESPQAFEALSKRLGPDALFVECVCAGRIPPWLLLKALESGTEKILVAACKESGCRYGSGEKTRDTICRLQAVLTMLGIEADRLAVIDLDNEALTPDSGERS